MKGKRNQQFVKRKTRGCQEGCEEDMNRKEGSVGKRKSARVGKRNPFRFGLARRVGKRNPFRFGLARQSGEAESFPLPKRQRKDGSVGRFIPLSNATSFEYGPRSRFFLKRKGFTPHSACFAARATRSGDMLPHSVSATPSGEAESFPLPKRSAKDGSAGRYSGYAPHPVGKRHTHSVCATHSGEAESFPLPKRSAKTGSVDRFPP